MPRLRLVHYGFRRAPLMVWLARAFLVVFVLTWLALVVVGLVP